MRELDFWDKEDRGIGLVCQAKHDHTMLYVDFVRRKSKAREVKESTSKAARGLVLEEWDKIEGIWLHLSPRLVSDF